MSKLSLVTLLAAALCLAAPPSTMADDYHRTEDVQFAKGTSSKTITGSIKGDQDLTYVLRVKAGQTIKVSMKTSNASAYFNVVAPGVDDALFVGSASGSTFTGKAPVAGPHRIIVYLMRNAARRNETANFTLTIGVTG